MPSVTTNLLGPSKQCQAARKRAVGAAMAGLKYQVRGPAAELGRGIRYEIEVGIGGLRSEHGSLKSSIRVANLEVIPGIAIWLLFSPADFQQLG